VEGRAGLGGLEPGGVVGLQDLDPPALGLRGAAVLIALWMELVLVFSGIGAYAGVDWLVTKARIGQALKQFGSDLQQSFPGSTTP
jgi:hypothetical protein